MSILDSETNDMLWDLYKLCSQFISDNNITCAEATVEDRVYENAPALIEQMATLIGYSKLER